MNKSIVSTTIVSTPMGSVPQLIQGGSRKSELEKSEPEKRQILSNVLHRKTGVLASVAIAAIAGSYLVPAEPYLSHYEGSLKLSLEPKEENTSLSNPGLSNPGAVQVDTSALSIDYETQARVLWSPKLLSPVIAQLQKQYPDLNYDRLSHNLKITHPEGSRTLEISYQDIDAGRTQAVLEQLSQAYLKYSQESPANNQSALQFIEKRVPELQQEVAQTQNKMRQFQQQQYSANPDQLGQKLAEQSNVLTQQQQELQSQLLEAQTAYAVLQQRSAESYEQLSKNSLPENSLPENQSKSLALEPQRLESQLLDQQSPDYQELLNQFQATATQLATERSRPESDLDPAKQQLLEQRYQQLSEKLTQTVQQPLVDRLSQLNKDFKPENSLEAHRLEMLMELKVTDNQVRMLEISYGTIVQTKALLGERIQQWAGLARQYDQLQLESQLVTNKLNLSLAKQAELQTFIQSAWQIMAPPQVKPMAESGFTLSVTQRNLSLSLVLCFIVVVWVMTSRKGAKRSQKIGSPLPNLQSNHSALISQNIQPLALEIPRAKMFCLVENDDRLLLTWGGSSLQKSTGGKRIPLKGTAS